MNYWPTMDLDVAINYAPMQRHRVRVTDYQPASGWSTGDYLHLVRPDVAVIIYGGHHARLVDRAGMWLSECTPLIGPDPAVLRHEDLVVHVLTASMRARAAGR